MVAKPFALGRFRSCDLEDRRLRHNGISVGIWIHVSILNIAFFLIIDVGIKPLPADVSILKEWAVEIDTFNSGGVAFLSEGL